MDSSYTAGCVFIAIIAGVMAYSVGFSVGRTKGILDAYEVLNQQGKRHVLLLSYKATEFLDQVIKHRTR